MACLLSNVTAMGIDYALHTWHGYQQVIVQGYSTDSSGYHDTKESELHGEVTPRTTWNFALLLSCSLVL